MMLLLPILVALGSPGSRGRVRTRRPPNGRSLEAKRRRIWLSAEHYDSIKWLGPERAAQARITSQMGGKVGLTERLLRRNRNNLLVVATAFALAGCSTDQTGPSPEPDTVDQILAQYLKEHGFTGTVGSHARGPARPSPQPPPRGPRPESLVRSDLRA